MKETLTPHIQRLKENLAGISRNPVLEMFEEERCADIDKRSEKELYVEGQRDEIIRHLKKTGTEHTASLEHAFGLYNEIQVFDHLQKKCAVTPVKRSNKENRPDFTITGKEGVPINLELKTLFAADSVNLIRDVQEQLRQMNEKVKQIQAGELPPHTTVSASWNFFKKPGQQTVQRIDIIELLYSKLDKPNTIKQLGYQGNPGILMIDFAAYDYIFCPQEALPNFIYPSYHKAMVSGLFWQLCFGRKGERLMEMPQEMDMGRPCMGTVMKRDGLLYKHPEIKALIIAIKYGEGKRLVGLHSVQMEDPSILTTIHRICAFVNNDLNIEYYRIGYDASIKYWPDDPDRSVVV